MWVERTTSIPDAMPLAFLSTAGIILTLARRSRQRLELVVLAALCTPLMVTSMTVGIAARYLVDAYPLVAVGMAFSASQIPLFKNSINKTDE